VRAEVVVHSWTMATSPKSIAWLAGFLEGRFGLDAGTAHLLADQVGRDERLWVEVSYWTQTSVALSTRTQAVLDSSGLPWKSAESTEEL
jgi:hypothetical protein